jgi:hypothetical protein
MIIRKKKYPILEKLKTGSLGNMPIYESDRPFFNELGLSFTSNWKFIHNDFLREINIISDSFNESAQKAEKNLISLYQDIVVNDTSDLDVYGTFILKDLVLMISYSVKKGSEDQEIFFYIFSKEGIPLGVYVDSAKHKIYQNAWVSQTLGLTKQNMMNFLMGYLVKTIILKMFKSYAKVETKNIPANGRIKDFNCKYINETGLNITFLDCKWFTDIVRSEGFSVRGHFRLQPKKHEGKWTKELIWIEDFKKHGYNLKAKIRGVI